MQGSEHVQQSHVVTRRAGHHTRSFGPIPDQESGGGWGEGLQIHLLPQAKIREHNVLPAPLFHQNREEVPSHKSLSSVTKRFSPLE